MPRTTDTKEHDEKTLDEDVVAAIAALNKAEAALPNRIIKRCSPRVFRLSGSRKARLRKEAFRLHRRELRKRFNT